jgi:poly-gamma-glutamate capsule biosynthesis protein CapA/YwtB (metallophosphatase superfamily)
VSFAVFGDNLIHEPIYNYGLNNDPNFTFLYKNVKEIINKSDISIINQETPLVDNPSLYSDYPLFGTPINVGKAIVNAGFDVVTCATNHALDKGMYGIDTTKNFFTENNITCLGIQTTDEKEYIPYEIITKNHIKIALLNYTYGTNGIKIPEENQYAVHLLNDEEQIKSDIKSAKENADIVIILPHWGTENSTEIDETQKYWTDIFLESGADVVIGIHPHALQPYEFLTSTTGHQMLIYYSIGNYISAQSEQTSQKGGIATFTITLTTDGYKVTDYNLTPLTIIAYGEGKFVPMVSP